MASSLLISISEKVLSLIANRLWAVLTSAIINFPFTSFLGVKTPEETTFLVFPIGLIADSGYLGFTENI